MQVGRSIRLALIGELAAWNDVVDVRCFGSAFTTERLACEMRGADRRPVTGVAAFS